MIDYLIYRAKFAVIEVPENIMVYTLVTVSSLPKFIS